jgi:hypothetical protein
MTTNLECRLLCAGVTTDAITKDGPITPQPAPYFGAAQFVDEVASPEVVYELLVCERRGVVM